VSGNQREYCHHCGVPITEPSSFCGHCGAPLATAREPQPVAVGPGEQTHAARTTTTPNRSMAGAPQPRGSHQNATALGEDAPEIPRTRTSSAPAADGESARSSRRWLPGALVGGGTTLVAAVVAVLLLTLGGSAGKNVKNANATRQQALQLLAASGTTTVSSAAPGLFALVTTGKLSAIVPAGWRAAAQTTTSTTRAQFANPKSTGSSITIVAQGTRGENAHNQAGAALHAVRSKGAAVSSYGAIMFPGGREAWQVTYAETGLTHETYFYAACNGMAAMVVDVAAPTARFQRERTAFGATAASAEPSCS
jgi:hypothetical protein